MTKKKGPVVIIGGKEEKNDGEECVILKLIAKSANHSKGRLLIVTTATQYPKEVAEEYREVFKQLGVTKIGVLDIRDREEAMAPEVERKLSDASVIFFTGGDQLRITSQIGDTPVYETMRRIHESGGMIAGTSAGAAALSEVMVFGAGGDESQTISSLGMAPGLGLMPGIVIDSHFAERGRFGRLLGAVAQNPKNLGVGIDENTAIKVEDESSFTVFGSGAVYVVDGRDIEYSNLSEARPEGVLSIFNAKLHVLGRGDSFSLTEKKPHSRG